MAHLCPAIIRMSSGVFGESTALDHWASDTALDAGDQCEEVLDTLGYTHIQTTMLRL